MTPREVFSELLQKAVNEPGIISQAYRQFHQYSIGNQILAWTQCADRDLQPGPINTYLGWKALGRYVRKGEKALVLCMPITVKRRPSGTRYGVRCGCPTARTSLGTSVSRKPSATRLTAGWRAVCGHGVVD